MNNLRNLALWIIIALLLVALFNMFQGTARTRRPDAHLHGVHISKSMQGQVK